jgi:hypothetical protein
MTTTFENAKAGDKVWSMTKGWGTIAQIEKGFSNPIKVDFDNESFSFFNINGTYFDTDLNQTLFWDEIKFEAPPQPPQTKLVHGVEIPDISFNPKNGEDYYAIDLTDKRFYIEFQWRDDEMDFTLCERDLCYPHTEEGKQAAILHAKAMLGIKES